MFGSSEDVLSLLEEIPETNDVVEKLELFRRVADLMVSVHDHELHLKFSPRIAGILIELPDVYARSTDLEAAISMLTMCLDVNSGLSETDPSQYSELHRLLGDAFLWQSTRTDEGQLSNVAIGHYREAIRSCPRTTNSLEWAKLQQALGVAYLQGYEEHSAVAAVACFREALEVCSPKQDVLLWATLHSDLALACLRGTSDEAAEEAIQHLKCALRVLDRESSSFFWAHAQHRLGLAYRYRSIGDNSDNLRTAISHFELALNVFSLEEDPETWAETIVELGQTVGKLSDVSDGDRDQQLDKGIRLLKMSQRVFTKLEVPREWASIELDIASLCFKRSKPDAVTTLKEANAHYQNAADTYEQLGDIGRARTIREIIAIKTQLAEQYGSFE